MIAGPVLPLLLTALLAATPDAEIAAKEALDLYRAGNFAAAAVQFDRAWRLSRNPTQLRNAAKAYTKAEDLAAAAQRWRRYLELDLSADKREVAEESLTSVRARLETKRAAEQSALAGRGVAAAPPQAVTEPVVVGPSPIPWLVGGLGGAAVAAGAGLYLSGWVSFWDADGAGEPTIFREDADSARLRSGIGIGLAAAGAVAVVAAILWPDSVQTVQASVTPLPGGGAFIGLSAPLH